MRWAPELAIATALLAVAWLAVFAPTSPPAPSGDRTAHKQPACFKLGSEHAWVVDCPDLTRSTLVIGKAPAAQPETAP